MMVSWYIRMLNRGSGTRIIFIVLYQWHQNYYRDYIYIYIYKIYTHTHIYSYSHTLILFGLILGNSVISSTESVSDDSVRSQEKKKKVFRKEVDTPNK